MKTTSKNASVSLTDDQRESLLCSALEGGSNYWYSIDEPSGNKLKAFVKQKALRSDGTFVGKMFAAVKAGHAVQVNELETGKKLGIFSLESIRKGEGLMISNHIEHFCDVLSGNDDAITGDVWFQLCVMGEIIYG